MITDAELPPPLQTAELTAARGTIRDALGAVRNLWELLKSVRVGPKALRVVIPDVLAACGPLLQSLEILLAQIPATAGAECLEGLRGLTIPRVKDLERALIKERRRPLRAAERLALERTVVGVFRDLDVGLMLMELLYASKAGRPMLLDAGEMTRELASFPDSASPSFRRVAVELEVPAEPVNVSVDARAVMNLLTVLIGLASTDLGRAVTVVVSQASPGRCRIDLAPDASAPNLSMTVPVGVAATWQCAKAVCACLDIELDRSGETLTLLFPSTVS